MAKKAEAELKVKVTTEGSGKLKKLKTSMGELGSEIVSKGKAIGVAVLAITAAITALAVKAADFDIVKNAFEKLTAAQGVNSDKILKTMQNLTDGMISSMDLMIAANKGALLGLPIDKFPEMLKIAKSASEATGESMQFMLDSIVVGLGRQSKLILDNLGIMIDIEVANRTYAESLGTVASALTESEKKQAFINEAMRIGLENANKLSGENKSVSKSWQQLKVRMEEASIALGKDLIPLVTLIIDEVKSFSSTTKSFGRENFMLQAVTLISKAIVMMSDTVKKAGIGVEALWENAKLLKAKILFNKDDAFAAEEELRKLGVEEEKISLETGRKLNEIDERRQVKKLELAIEFGKEIADADLAQAEDIRQAALDVEKKKQTAILKGAKDTKAKEVKEKKKLEDTAAAKETESRLKKEENLEFILRQRHAEFLDFKEEQRLTKEIAADEAALVRAQEAANQLQTFLSSGFEGLATSAVTSMVETLLPGFGGAAGQMFALLSQDSDAFIESVNQIFSVKFIDNIIKNIPILLQTIIDKLPEIVEHLIIALIEAAPEISVALAKAVGDPRFALALVNAVVNGFTTGIAKALEDVAGNVRDLFKNIKIPGLSGATGGASGAVESVKSFFGFKDGGLVPNMPVQHFAKGGTVDTVPAMLSPGEFVVTPDATRNNLDTLKSINAGGSGGKGNSITINVNGGLMGDENSAREFARVIDMELLKLRQENESLSFDEAVF